MFKPVSVADQVGVKEHTRTLAPGTGDFRSICSSPLGSHCTVAVQPRKRTSVKTGQCWWYYCETNWGVSGNQDRSLFIVCFEAGSHPRSGWPDIAYPRLASVSLSVGITGVNHNTEAFCCWFQCWVLNPGLCTSKASTIPLSHTPSPWRKGLTPQPSLASHSQQSSCLSLSYVRISGRS